jgi:hypothetical protein
LPSKDNPPRLLFEFQRGPRPIPFRHRKSSTADPPSSAVGNVFRGQVWRDGKTGFGFGRTERARARRRVKRNPNKISKPPGFAAEWEFAVCRSRITSTTSPMPVSSAPMTRTPPGSSVRFRGCSFSCLRWRQLLWKCRRGSLPRLRRAVFGAQREQPSYRGNFTGHSRLT